MSFGERKLDRSKPEIDFPEGEAPTELVSTDLVEGTGAEATLRETWGGPLCVVTVERTDADLTTVNTELQSALGEQASHGARRHLGPDATIGAQRPQHERHAHAWMLAPDVAQ